MKKIFFTEITVSLILWADDEEDAKVESRCLLIDLPDEAFDTYVEEIENIYCVQSHEYDYIPWNGGGRDERTLKEIFEEKETT